MTLTKTKIMLKQAEVYQTKINGLDKTIVCLEELIEMLKAEAVIDDVGLELAYEDHRDAIGQRAVLLFCKEALSLDNENRSD